MISMTSHKPFTLERARYRPARIAKRIKEELMLLIPESLGDLQLEGIDSVTITSVEMSPNLRDAAVMFSMYDSGVKDIDPKTRKKYEAALNQAAGSLRGELMHSLNMKMTPHLVFKYDKGYENERHINDLLREIGSCQKATQETHTDVDHKAAPPLSPSPPLGQE
jgi:ribosome-binding factor A